jgi:hypothetical protein
MRGLAIARDLGRSQSYQEVSGYCPKSQSYQGICQEPSHIKGFGLGSSQRQIRREPRSRDLSVDNACRIGCRSALEYMWAGEVRLPTRDQPEAAGRCNQLTVLTPPSSGLEPCASVDMNGAVLGKACEGHVGRVAVLSASENGCGRQTLLSKNI